ncbi:MAG: ATP-binding cassette domain-containing protein [Spirochaetaceae bacterium]|nr:MAG: ATP-binding cassette domain-containing protein [Spirochaetaceae bacterium]
MVPVLAAEQLRKEYGQVQALLDASITLRPGAIHGLVGENGAGKTTLVRLLAGMEEPDSGSLFPALPQRRSDCAVVPQYPRMAPSIPVLQNLIIGSEPRRSSHPLLRLLIDEGRAKRRMEAIAERFDIQLDLGKRAGSLNGTELRLAALLAALAHEPAILILDEPTVGLAATDQERVLATVRALRAEGIAILYISHDLAEISRIADSVTILIQGRSTDTFDPVPEPHRLASILFDHRRQDERHRAGKSDGGPDEGGNGRERRSESAPDCPAESERPAEPAQAVIAFEEVSLYDRYSGRTLGPLSFSLEPGTITAVTGVREAGLDLLEQYLSGEGELSSGAIRIAGHRIPAQLAPGTLRRQGIAFVPSDRFERAAALEGSVEENATVTDRLQIHPRGIRTPGEAQALTRRLLDRFDIRTHRHMPLRSLSGGMIQKLILARELDTNPRVCIIAEPTAGLDLQSQRILLDSLREIAAAGAGVLILSSSIDAVTTLAQQVVVLHDGIVQGIFSADRSDLIARAFAGLDTSEGCP